MNSSEPIKASTETTTIIEPSNSKKNQNQNNIKLKKLHIYPENQQSKQNPRVTTLYPHAKKQKKKNIEHKLKITLTNKAPYKIMLYMKKREMKEQGSCGQIYEYQPKIKYNITSIKLNQKFIPKNNINSP